MLRKLAFFFLFMLVASSVSAQHNRSALSTLNNTDFYSCGNGCITGAILNAFNVPIANLTQLAVSPSFAGSDYIYGGS